MKTETDQDLKIDPDIFQVFVMVLSATADLLQIKSAAGSYSGIAAGNRIDNTIWDQIEKLHRSYQEAFRAMERCLSVYSRYSDSLVNADDSVVCGFGAFLANMDAHDFGRFNEAKRELMTSVTNVGTWSATLMRHMPQSEKFSQSFWTTQFLNYRDLNELLRSDCSYDELVLKLRDLKDAVETFFEGVRRNSNY